jgi:hypothetical protein
MSQVKKLQLTQFLRNIIIYNNFLHYSILDEATGWIGSYASGEQVTVSHQWVQQDTFLIKVCAKNEHDVVSDWGIIEVEVPRDQMFFSHPFYEFIHFILCRISVDMSPYIL